MQQVQQVYRWVGRGIGLDLHREFREIVICEDGVVRSAGRVATTPEALEALAASLESTDRVAMEVSGGAWEVARILELHCQRVVVASPDDTGIAQARTKTDELDARTLASLLWKGELEAVWMPDERARVLRRRLARREQLIHTRTGVKNELHAVLMRRLQGKPPCSDLFGVKGRGWLRSLSLPPEEVETVQSALRQIAFLDREIEQVERLVAKQMLTWPQAMRLMTVPGVNLIAAATFLAAVGEITRFSNSGDWSPTSVSTRESDSPASSPPARAASQSAAECPPAGRWSRRPGGWSTSAGRARLLHADQGAPRSRPRRSSPPRANSRSCLVHATRGQDYAHQQPSLTAQKLRRLEIAAGAPVRVGKPSGVWVTHQKMRQAEKQLAAQAQASYGRAVRDWQASGPKKKDAGASVTVERA